MDANGFSPGAASCVWPASAAGRYSPPRCRVCRLARLPARQGSTSCSCRTCTGATTTPRSIPTSRARCPGDRGGQRARPRPDFVVFTGDLTQTTDDPKVRRARLREFRDRRRERRRSCATSPASTTPSLDRGEAYQEVFGGTLNYTFDHKGVHFIVLDNTSDPAPMLGEAQLDWLRGRPRGAYERRSADRGADPPAACSRSTRSGTGRPATARGDRPADAVSQRDRVLRPHPPRAPSQTGHIEHHAAQSVMFPLSPVGTVDKKTQLPWDPAALMPGWAGAACGAPRWPFYARLPLAGTA